MKYVLVLILTLILATPAHAMHAPHLSHRGRMMVVTGLTLAAAVLIAGAKSSQRTRTGDQPRICISNPGACQ